MFRAKGKRRAKARFGDFPFCLSVTIATLMNASSMTLIGPFIFSLKYYKTRRTRKHPAQKGEGSYDYDH